MNRLRREPRLRDLPLRGLSGSLRGTHPAEKATTSVAVRPTPAAPSKPVLTLQPSIVDNLSGGGSLCAACRCISVYPPGSSYLIDAPKLPNSAESCSLCKLISSELLGRGAEWDDIEMPSMHLRSVSASMSTTFPYGADTPECPYSEMEVVSMGIQFCLPLYVDDGTQFRHPIDPSCGCWLFILTKYRQPFYLALHLP